MTRRWIAFGLLVVVLLGTVAPVASFPGSDSQQAAHPAATALATTDSSNITITQRLRLTPDRPGEIGVTVAVTIPDRVEGLELRVPDSVSVTDTDGFEQASGDRYEWTEAVAEPTITYDLPANRTATGEGPEPGSGTYLYADTGSWAIVSPPGPGVGYQWRGEDVSVERRLTVPGEGVAGERMAYLGPSSTYSRTAHGQTFKLTVPSEASMVEDPDQVLATFATASDRLRVGDRDEQVFTIVAPSDVDWAVRGLQTADSDMWVAADQSVDEADNTWLHEYVHSRQRLNTTTSTRWLVEGSATYYAAKLALEGDLVDFQAFHRTLDRGTADRYDEDVLANPSTWSYRGQYDKGGLVTGELDRQIRLETDRTSRFDAVFKTLNARDSRFDHQRFVETVAGVSTQSVAEVADRYVTTTDRPSMWEQTEHDAAFGVVPAQFTYQLPPDSDPYRIESRFRNVSVEPLPTLVVGESLRIPVNVTNVGGTSGTYDTTVTIDGEDVAGVNGELAPGDSSTVTVPYTFEAPGSYRLGVGDATTTVTVSEPATPTIDSLTVNRTTIEGAGDVSVVATVRGNDSIPSEGPISTTRNGSVLGEEFVRLTPGGSQSVETTISLPQPGVYELGAGEKTVTVTVREQATPTPTPTSTPTSTPTQTATPTADGASGTTTTSLFDSGTASPGDESSPTTASGPGFTVLLALVAVLFAVGGLKRR
ncbi:CARDB domain-containing protein [Halorhabdus salina]|uniref:CARDB domain-containing protein n=1 Tax=Halorhabdus salina TaxID=2750670 RepID=UPI0015EEAF2F|nr:CARDB domain-containing protein [Halorhabdus salina]